MRAKILIIEWLLTGDAHHSLTKEEMVPVALNPLIQALFPGINYFSITGFGQVLQELVVPALNKQFPELADRGPALITSLDATREVKEVLPSDGYQWQTDPAWRQRFDAYLEA
jgi:hypothetical protein